MNNINKKIVLTIVIGLLVSTGAVMAETPPRSVLTEDTKRVGNPGTVTGNDVTGNGNGTIGGKGSAKKQKGPGQFKERMPDMAGPGKQIVQNIVREKVQAIHEIVMDRNFTGKDVSNKARQIGVEVKEFVMAKVAHNRNRTMKKIKKFKNPEEQAKHAVKLGKKMQYDYGFGKFLEEADQVEKEAKEAEANVSRIRERTSEAQATYLKFQQGNVSEEQMKQEVQQFRETARQEIGQHRFEQTRNRVEASEKVKGMKKDSWAHLQNVSLIVFDKKIENAEHVLTVFEEKISLNTTEMQTRLDEIKGKRTELQEAYEAQDREQVNQVNRDIKQLWQEFRKMHSDVVREQIAGDTIQKMDKITERAMNKTEQVNLPQDEQGIKEMRNLVQEAKKNYENANYGLAQQKLEQVRGNFSRFRKNLEKVSYEAKEEE